MDPITMIVPRKSGERAGEVDGGRRSWTEPGFRSLDSFRELELAPGAGVEFEAPRELELLVYVQRGALTLLEAGGKTVPLDVGECYRSTARAGAPSLGSNGSSEDAARVFQCFIVPDRSLLRSPAEKRRYSLAERRGLFRLLGSRGGRSESLRLRQDVDVYSAVLDPGQHLVHELGAGRGAWLHVVEGRVRVAEHVLERGDGASVVEEPGVSVRAEEPSEILFIDAV